MLSTPTIPKYINTIIMSTSSSQARKSSKTKKQNESSSQKNKSSTAMKVPPVITVYKVYDDNMFTCYYHADCKKIKMKLREFKSHVTASSKHACFYGVDEPKMFPIQKKNVTIPGRNQCIVYNKEKVKFVCGHCFDEDNDKTCKPIGVMGLFSHRIGATNLKGSCVRLNNQKYNVEVNAALYKTQKKNKENREKRIREESMSLENSTVTASSCQKKTNVPHPCVSCEKFTDHNDTNTIICHNHHDCNNYICATHLSHFGMNPNDANPNNKLCYQCISGMTKNEPRRNFWCSYWVEHCHKKNFLSQSDFALNLNKLAIGTYLWILFPVENDDGGMFRGIITKLPKRKGGVKYKVKFFDFPEEYSCDLSDKGFKFVGEKKTKAKAKVVNDESEKLTVAKV